MKLGVAFAGGGLKGVAYAGVVKAFNELGINVDIISGTSSGAFAAVLYALGYTPDEMKDIINNSYKGLVKVPKKPIVSAAGTFLTRKKIKINGLIPGERVEKLVQKVAEEKGVSKIADLKIPFAAATVDTISTKECIFMSRNYNLKSDKVDYIYDVDIGKAIRSSMAFPGIFTPSRFDKYNFVDGGTVDNLPTEVLRKMGADVVLGLCFKLDDYDLDGQNIMSIILRTVDIFAIKDVDAGKRESDFAIEIDASGSSLMTIDNIDRIVDVGYRAIMDHKEEILNLIKNKETN